MEKVLNTWDQITLAPKLGGLGILEPSITSYFAYFASNVTSNSTFTDIFAAIRKFQNVPPENDTTLDINLEMHNSTADTFEKIKFY